MRKLYFLCWSAMLLLSACTSSYRMFSAGSLKSDKGTVDVSLPYRSYNSLQIVQVKFGNETYDFLFDTGAPMVVSPELRKKLEMKVLMRKSVYDSQGKRNDLNYVRMAPFELGGLKFENFTAIEADLRANAALNCLDIDGIVGANLMALFFWEMNPSQHLLRMTNNWDTLEVDEKMNVLNFRIKNTRTPVLDNIKLNDQYFSNITFDTGSDGSLRILKTDFADADDSNAVVSVGYHSYGIFGGEIDTQSTELVRFKIGNDSLAYFPLNLNNEKSTRLLGMSYIKNYRTILNWKQSKIYMQKVKEYSGQNDSAFGMAPAYIDSTLRVGNIFLRPKGVAEKLTLGDTILRVNGITTYPASPELYCQVLSKMRKANTLTVTIKAKGKVSLCRRPKFSGPESQSVKKDD